jgi:hypothetical protein
MKEPSYYIGPCFSCFYAVYASLNGEIQQITKFMSYPEVVEALQKIQTNPYKLWKGVKRVY